MISLIKKVLANRQANKHKETYRRNVKAFLQGKSRGF